MTPNVRRARNIVIGMGIFIFAGGVFMLITEPAKWLGWLMEFAVAVMCWGIVRGVNSGPGEWRKDGKNRPGRDEPAP